MSEDWQHYSNGHHHHLLRFWPYLKFKMFGRRHFGWGHFLCRVPLILLWLFVVILILYKSNKSDESDNVQYNIEPELLQWSTVRSAHKDSDLTKVVTHIKGTTNQLLIPATIEQSELSNSNPNLLPVKSATRIGFETKVSSDIGNDPNSRTTTRKSPARDYMRRSEIFILIVQDHDRASKAHRLGSVNLGANLYPNSDAKLNPKSKDSHRLIIPAHIRQMIEVLTYHRIDYTLSVMHNGLPSELLQNPKRYSVIVIDDFIKYDKLNRWARDQLDRYCRSNRIGVITYLIDNGKLSYRRFASDSIDSHNISSEILIAPRAMPKFSDTADETTVSTEQYPLSFRLLNSNCPNLTSANCLVDYQLSDKAPLLRILKRKPDFIVKGELSRSLGCSSVVTMSSNHATHEPLTWARLRRLKSTIRERSKRQVRSHVSHTFPPEADTTNQPNGYHHATHIRKRAVLPHSTSLSGEHEIPYDAQNLQSSEYLAGKSEPIDDSDAPRTGGDTQSGHSIGPDLDDDPASRRVISMLDHGLYDDVRRVIFGISNHHWLNRLLLLDAIEYLSSGQILTPLERYIQIDIDDIFVGASGTRLNSSDVLALIEAQKQFRSHVRGGFKFNLGFSGKYFKRGSEAEQSGDELLVANSREFTWFCHFWSHSKAHLFNTTEALSMELIRNLKFAEDNNLTLIGHREPLKVHHLDNGRQLPPTYAVAPHHSGVYPIHEELYEAWLSILNVQVTTTEEYPHLRPASQRRGFVHKTIMVLPRQTCGLYTHTIYRNKYPGGFNKLLANIRGGELFETIVHNPVNIYMTHMSNYANDHLALFTFKALFEFVEENTNLQLIYSPSPTAAATPTTSTTISDADEYDGGFNSARTGPGGPLFLADYYFNLHPKEKEPLWTNPCDDKRHLAIWSAGKLKFCDIAPKLLIVGPQKTGTTALLSFLRLNPTVGTSSISSEDFEEVQFFNDKHYSKGSDWYFERFLDSEWSPRTNSTPQLYIDKSATYFDDPKAPERAGSLLPNAHIAILLVNPADRAYSWYQHIKAHGDPMANEFSFDQVIMSQDSTSETQLTSSPALNLGMTRGSSSASSSSTSSSGSTSWRLTDRQVAAVRGLRNRCLHPGYYSNHLLKWLDHYPSCQIIIIDGEWFKLNPAAVLNRLQLVLRLPQQLDYDKLLVYNKRKGFYCERVHRTGAQTEGLASNQHLPPTTNIKCLGSGKGRKYAPMSAEARNYLDDHYLSHNRQLARLLYEIGQPLPSWLDRSINSLPPTTARLL